MKEILERLKERSFIISLIFSGTLLVVIGLLFNSFALTEPISTISFTSSELNYETKEPGSWKVEKSAKWISSEKARITFNVDTILKTEGKNMDIILVLDISGSMTGDKLKRVKEDSKNLVNTLLSDQNNQIAMITFDTSSEILSEFTSNEELLMNKIDNLSTKDATNYYQALVNVDHLLKNYTKEENRDLITLFLTDGYPNVDVPNEIAEYNYLKEEYPYLTIQGIQYEMGESVLDPIKKISDNQFVADMENLNNILLDASIEPDIYDSFTLTDYIDTDNFYIEDISDISVSEGKVELDKEEQKITWVIDELKTGSKPTMTIDVTQKEEAKNKELLPTNKKESVESKLDSVIENIESGKTPVLKGSYQVIYEGNAPSGCSVSNLPEIKSYHPFGTVEIDGNQPVCEEYQFRGWRIVTEGVTKINQEYFTMPEKDVILRAEWSYITISKSMDGTIYEYIPSVLRQVSIDDSADIWKYKNSITKVVFQNSISPIYEAKENFDISEEQNGGIMGYVVVNTEDSSTYTAYIQGDGKIIANEYSYNLFDGFTKLKEIEGLEYFDTQNTVNMSNMFNKCSNLTNLDVSHFDTSKVTNMSFMFAFCNSLVSLNLSNFNTSNVIDMNSMFAGNYSSRTGLTSLDISNFNTSRVTDMNSIFKYCSNLTSIDIGNFDTTNVTNMSSMFSGCSGLTSLDISHFDTSNVVNMTSMFSNCSKLTSIDVGHFNTSNVTSMSWMFNEDTGLVSLDLSSFDTSNVTDMSNMFNYCSKLTALDVSHFDTSNVTTMAQMFSSCSKLTSLNLNNFDTFKVTNMRHMFSSCSSLKKLDVSSFDTSNVTDMRCMFKSCSGLISLDISHFDTSNVVNMLEMFYYCECLITTINIYNPNVTSYTDMFKGSATKYDAKITVNYISSTSNLVNQMIATKTTNSKVVKGKLVTPVA